MLSRERIHNVVESVGETTAQNTGAFVTEQDFQAYLASQLLSTSRREAADKLPLRPELEGTGRVFDTYPAAMEAGFQESETGFPPVHMEVSLDKGERFDVAVFDEELASIDWAGDSKKFDVKDVAALFEVKFVYWTKMPTESGFHPSDYSRGELSDEETLSHFQFDQVGFKEDIERLGRRDEVPYRCAVMVSNLNHYYYRPTEKELEWNDFYDQMGKVMQNHLTEVAAEHGVNLLYVTPYNSEEDAGGAVWLHNALADEQHHTVIPD